MAVGKRGEAGLSALTALPSPLLPLSSKHLVPFYFISQDAPIFLVKCMDAPWRVKMSKAQRQIHSCNDKDIYEKFQGNCATLYFDFDS